MTIGFFSLPSGDILQKDKPSQGNPPILFLKSFFVTRWPYYLGQESVLTWLKKKVSVRYKTDLSHQWLQEKLKTLSVFQMLLSSQYYGWQPYNLKLFCYITELWSLVIFNLASILCAFLSFPFFKRLELYAVRMLF